MPPTVIPVTPSSVSPIESTVAVPVLGTGPTMLVPAVPVPPTQISALAMIPCPTCHVPTPVAKFCTDCGALMETKRKFCSACGTELKPTAKFCDSCGAKV
jgi:hypothetical protein